MNFDKNKTIEKNAKEFEKYALQLDKEFGKILLQILKKNDTEIRDTAKVAISEFISKQNNK